LSSSNRGDRSIFNSTNSLTNKEKKI